VCILGKVVEVILVGHPVLVRDDPPTLLAQPTPITSHLISASKPHTSRQTVPQLTSFFPKVFLISLSNFLFSLGWLILG
jgi:hypothetical protein